MNYYRTRAYPYTVITPPAGDPTFITILEARAHLGLNADPDPPDAEVLAFINQAQAAVERFTRLTLFNTGFQTFRDFFPLEIELRRAPLQSVEEIASLLAGTFEVFDNANYKLISTGMPFYGKVVLKDGACWPIDIDDERESVRIQFTAGFGADATSLPPDLVAGAKRVLTDIYENRGDCDSCDALSQSAKALLTRFIIMDI